MSDKCEIVPRVGGFVKISDSQLTDFFCFSDSVLPPRSPTVLILRPNMILASCFLGLILANSQLFVPGVEGDRVSDAIDTGESFYNFL